MPILEQADEDWLAEFRKQIKTDWDFTAVHINKHTLAGVKTDIVNSLKAHWFVMFNRLIGFLRHVGTFYALRQAHLGNGVCMC
jgi:hypothetical protein